MSTSTIINWGDICDRIVCLLYLPNKNRMPWCEIELKRVGIWDSGNFSFDYGVPSVFDSAIYEAFRNRYNCQLKPHYLSYTMQYERVLEQSYAMGANRTLIIEDDCCFLKDLGKLKVALESMPSDFEVFQFDKGMYSSRLPAWNNRKYHYSVNDFWCDCTNTPFVLSTANVYTLKAIEKILAKIKTNICESDQISRWYEGKWAIAKENLCIQLSYENSHMVAACGKNKMHDMYKPLDIDYNNYNTPKGFGYGKTI